MWTIRPLLNSIVFALIGIIKSTMKLFIPLKYQMKNISGEIALVTGAAGGLGRELAINLVKHGTIVVIWDIDQEGSLTLIKYFYPFKDFQFFRNYKQMKNVQYNYFL